MFLPVQNETVAATSQAVLRLAGLGGAAAGLLLAITPCALWREDPMFWRNAGGWPILLRDVVELTFYPMVAAQLCVLLAFSAWTLLCPPPVLRRRHLWPATALLWCWTGAVLVLVVANNVENVLAGRPLHWHPL
jgi:hypothetical protein